ncbi:hypothetical protein JD844_031220 [Phrynosoma platyrhinos]|uniref:Aspartate transaminase n=1 Tax=Phrynosoma platyrhinos TaxID=52577 RepID=A0ABQ7T0Y3_PHRPL|nr:hypothetical protein JD844_031220 [Phrynosoma platyrhinos]
MSPPADPSSEDEDKPPDGEESAPSADSGREDVVSGLMKQSLQALVKRIMLIREKLKEKLRILGTPGSWEHLTTQSGVNSFIGLLPSQVEFLAKHKHIYLLPNGQINICSINSKNLNYVARSIHEAVLSTTVQDYSLSGESEDKIQLKVPQIKWQSETFLNS